MDLGKTISTALKDTKRILRLTRKPRKSEYTETAKITGAGIIVIGLVGYLILLVATILRG